MYLQCTPKRTDTSVRMQLRAYVTVVCPKATEGGKERGRKGREGGRKSRGREGRREEGRERERSPESYPSKHEHRPKDLTGIFGFVDKELEQFKDNRNPKPKRAKTAQAPRTKQGTNPCKPRAGEASSWSLGGGAFCVRMLTGPIG